MRLSKTIRQQGGLTFRLLEVLYIDIDDGRKLVATQSGHLDCAVNCTAILQS